MKYPHWQREFEAAVLEGDSKTVRARIDAAEAALFLRSQALAEAPADSPEHLAIADAIRTIRTLQREKLGYPPLEK
jgi:hypothetical protein